MNRPVPLAARGARRGGELGSGRNAGTATAPGWRSRRAIWSVLSVAYLLVAAWTPLTLWPEAGHDDGHFMKGAQALLDGDWFGEYNQLTLIKGPGYAFFLYLTGFTGLPVTVTTALFRIVAAGAFALAVARATDSPRLATPLFAATLWNPVSLTASLLRVVRDSIYSEQLLLVLAGTIAVCFVAASPRARLLRGGATGLALGWFWLTREEGIWIVPAILLLFVAACVRPRRRVRDRLRQLAPAAVALVAGCLLVQAAFQTGNRLVYGSFVGVDFKQPEFRRALTSLYSAGNASPVPYLPVPRATRDELYRVSPAFATLASSLDPPSGPVWQWGCRYYASTCGDIAGGWFHWALRDAVASRGQYESPRTAAEFYARLADEVDAACDRGAIRCRRGWFDYVQRPSAEQLRSVPDRFRNVLRWIAFRERPALDAAPSVGRSESLAWASELLNRPLAAPADSPALEIEISYLQRGAGWLSGEVATGGTTTAVAFVALEKRRDAQRIDGSRLRRFRAVVRAEPTDAITLRSDDGATATVTVADLLDLGRRIELGDGVIRVERGGDLDRPQRADARVLAARRVRGALIELYAGVVPSLLAAGAAAFVLAIVRWARARRLPALLALAAASWLLLVGRAALLVVFDMTAFPAIHALYLSPAYHLAVIAPLLSISALLNGLFRVSLDGREAEPRA